ncbi:MAG: hypothetical protein ACI4EQ_05540 [Lachnospiraceae bacterium]
MNKQSRKRGGLSFTSGIGSSSILVIFVILCLVSFATLSIVSAHADYKLSGKVLERTTAYYAAVHEAEVDLAQLNKTLLSLYESSASKEEYFAAAGHHKSFLVPVSDLQSLEVAVTILYPQNDTDTFYTIDTYRVIITGELEYEEELQLLFQ